MCGARRLEYLALAHGRLDSAPSTAQESPAPISLAVLPLSSVVRRERGLSGGRHFRRHHHAPVKCQTVSGAAHERRRAVSRPGHRCAGRWAQARIAVCARGNDPCDRRSRARERAARAHDRWIARLGPTSTDVARGDLLGIEDAVAERISSALRVQMSDAERERFYRRYTRNGAAYERYLMGRARLRALTEQGALHAIAEFEAARDRDPSYALAYAGLATAAAQLRVRFSSQKGSRGLGCPRSPGSPPRAPARP